MSVAWQALLALLGLCALSLGRIDSEGARKAGVEIRPSPGKGLGAFTTRSLKLGDHLGSYEGEVLTEREWQARLNRKGPLLPEDDRWLASRRRRGVGLTGDYILAFGDREFICAEDPECGNWCRYMNHGASRPNVGLFRERGADGVSRPTFIVIESCEPGDELLWHYGDGHFIDGAVAVE